MVRKDNIDPGVWSKTTRNKLISHLIFPIDTHIAKICKLLNIISSKNLNLKDAMLITNFFRQFDNNDPLKYDFAICHLGIDNLRKKGGL